MKTTNITAARVKYLRNLKLDDTITWTVTGPRGGKSSNSRGTPSAGWTRAAHLAGYESEPYWSGSNPTPARHFGPAIIAAIHAAPADLQYH
jgi:hypothetical protein